MQSHRRCSLFTVDRVSQNRMSDASQVGSQLMLSPSQRPQPERCRLSASFTDSPQRRCRSSLWMIAISRRIALQASQTCINPTTTLQLPRHFGFVELVHASSGKEGTTATETFQTAGDQHHTRGISIKTMHQMEISTQPLQPRDKGILQVIAAAGLRQQSRRFQDHQ